jgi:hypothetical protein
LTELLLSSSSEIIYALMELRNANLVQQLPEGTWCVTSQGYPIVRQFLHGEGYVTDQF